MKIICVVFLLLLALSNGFAQSEGKFLMYSVHYNQCMENNLKLSVCNPLAGSQQFRWISKDRILNIYTKKCLGVGSKTVGTKLQWLMCEDDNVLQKWGCQSDLLLRLKNESLYLTVNDNDVALITKDTGTKSQWKIQGTENNICSRPYEELYTIDGNAQGRPCHFPFRYQDIWYADCTEKDADALWCAVESDVHSLWGYCPTSDTNNRLWVKNPLTKIYYQLNEKSKLTWHEARKSCQQQGAVLLSVSEPYEYSFATGMMLKKQDYMWTGLNKLNGSNEWQWGNGQPLHYVNWTNVVTEKPITEPDYCCGLLKPPFRMLVASCSKRFGYICQRDPFVHTLPPVPSLNSYCTI